MRKDIKIFRSSIGWLKIIFLVGLFSISSIATFSGFFDMLSQSADEDTISVYVFSTIFTFAVQGCLFYFVRQWWATRWWGMRIKYYLLPLCLTISISVIFGWGFFYDRLSLDKILAEQKYTEEHEKMIAVINSNQASIQTYVEKMEGLVKHSAEMVDKEAKGGNTCDVSWQGYGPRAAFRNRDKTIFESYAKKFEQTKVRFDEVHKEMSDKSLGYYTASNVKALNGYVQEMNVITWDFNENKRERLLGWLDRRNKHNNPEYMEHYDDGRREGYIRCPDEEIKDYYGTLINLKPFGELPPIKIADPNKLGVQVIQAINSLLELAEGNFFSNEFYALVFAVFTDVLIFMIAIVPPISSPPPPFTRWSEYFPNSEHKKLLKYIDLSEGEKSNFYIPSYENDLIASMLPLLANGLAVYKGKIPRWQEWFVVPSHIRAYGDGSGFGHYQTHHSCPAQWTVDFKYKEAVSQEGDSQQHPSYSNTSHKDDSKTISDTPSQVVNGGGDKKTGHDIAKISSNGNNKGVEDEA